LFFHFFFLFENVMSSTVAQKHSINGHSSDSDDDRGSSTAVKATSVEVESDALISDGIADETQTRSGAVYHCRVPDNYVSRHVLYNSFMRIRPIRGLKITVGQFLIALIILGLAAGLLAYEAKKLNLAPTAKYRGLHITGHITGYVFEYLLPLLFLPLSRNPNGLFPYLFGSSWEYLLSLHKRMGDLLIIMATVHAGTEVFFFNYSLKKDWKKTWDALKHWSNLSGLILLGVFLVLRLFAFSRLRKHYKYEVFHVLHVIFTIGAIYLLSCHVRHWDVTWKILLVPGILWVLDIIWRIVTSFILGKAKVVSKQTLHQSHATVLELELAHNRTFAFEPGQWAYLCVPAVCKVEFHPFAILAADITPSDYEEPDVTLPEDLQPERVEDLPKNVNRIKVLVKTLGDWTGRLESTPFSSLRLSNAYIQGPVGRIPTVFESFNSVILAGAGAGIAPIIGHAQRLYLTSKNAPHCASCAGYPGPRNIYVVLVVPGRDMLVPFTRDLSFLNNNPRYHLILFETGPNGGLYDPDTHVVSEEEKKMMFHEVKIGLPNMEEVFDSIREETLGVKTAVVTAGPPPFEKSVIAACRKHGFTLHCEADKW